MAEDYAIVTRVLDPATEKTVILAAGIETFGTLAASEFVTPAEYLGATLPGSEGLASEERAICVGYEDYRWHARTGAGSRHPRVVTLPSGLHWL